MTQALSTQISASIAWLFQDTLGLTTIADASRLAFDAQLDDGEDAGQANLVWHDLRTVAAGGHDDLVLSALPQTMFGNALSLEFAAVKALWLVNITPTAGAQLLVGAAPSAAWSAPFGAATHQVRVPADSPLLLVNKQAGWPVTNGSADTLRLSNPGSDSVDYKIVLIGTRF